VRQKTLAEIASKPVEKGKRGGEDRKYK